MPTPTDRGDANLIPPTEMLHEGTSSSDQFILFGDNFRDYILRPRAHLLPASAILDIGCGNGSVARSLTQFLSPAGRYEGVDVNAGTIAWLQDRYQPYPGFHFTHADVWTRSTTPAEPSKARSIDFPSLTTRSISCCSNPCSRTCCPPTSRPTRQRSAAC